MAVEQVDVEKENEKEPGKGWKTREKSSGGRERDREQRGNVNSVDESGRTRLHTLASVGYMQSARRTYIHDARV